MFKNFIIIIFLTYFFVATVFWPRTPLEIWMNSFFNIENSTEDNLIVNSSKISTPNSGTGSITEAKDLTTKEYVDSKSGQCTEYTIHQYPKNELSTATSSIYCAKAEKIISGTCHKLVYAEGVPSEYGDFIAEQYLIEVNSEGIPGIKCASSTYYLPRIVCCH